jgi:hypothetical protein
MTNEEIMKLLKERKARGKPYTDDEYAEFWSYMDVLDAMDEEELTSFYLSERAL